MNRALSIASLAAAAVLALAAVPALAQESRPFNPIGRPGGAAVPGAPVAATGSAPIAPPPPSAVRATVNKSIQKLADAWNTPELRKLLSPTYYDRDRVGDALVSKVPRDATLRVLGVESIQVLAQYTQPTTDGMEQEVITKVSVTLRTQVEFNDPVLGFQRREGLNEAIFTLKEIR
ncbi:hypothetical protein [Usitatibacter rugosus]|nr:hypothetical protein [Usitatibacter rugosus]